jgi:hypothetical protein
MSITTEEWKQIEEELQGVFATACFNLEQVEIVIQRKRISESTTVLAVFLDGEIRPAWGFDSHEQNHPLVERVWRKRSRSIYSPKEKARIYKSFGKRAGKKYFPKIEESQYWLDSSFTTAASLVRQFKKISGLELGYIGYKKQEAAACN